MPPLALIKSPAAPRGGAAGPMSRGELDARTLAQAQAGEPAACRALVQTYEARVFAVIGRMLGRRHVEDVAQECFLKVFGALGRFDPQGPAKLSTWIYTITTRVCLDELRRGRRNREDLDDHDGVAERAIAPTGDAEAAVLARVMRARVERALAALSPELRATFALRVTAELSVEETARALGVDEGTVKSRLSRAREKLRREIGEV